MIAGLADPSSSTLTTLILVALLLLLLCKLDWLRQQQNQLASAHQSLAKQEARYRLLADSATDVIMLKSIDGRRSYVSPACREMFGYEPQEFLAIPSASFVHAEDLERVRILNRGISPSNPHATSIHRLRHKRGHFVWVEAAFRLTETSEGEPIVLGAIRDVSERHRQAEELKQAKEEAEQANRAKTDFLASMSHEIRTPLNGILGYADLLSEEELTPDQSRSVERIQTAGAALLTVLNDVLDFSKVEAGQLELTPEPFQLLGLIDNSVSIVSGVAKKKGIPIEVTLGPGLPGTLIGDQGRVRQILLNLLNNAVKFTAEGHVALKVTCASRDESSATLWFEVTDTGIGIPPSKLPSLFQRFSQADASIHRRYGGTGLGLAICKQLVDLMGGEISAGSEQGKGSSFWFCITFPLASNEQAGADSEKSYAAGCIPRRILVAEDVEINQEVVRAVLESVGHEVDIVSDGSDAVSAVQAERYDVVLMDMQMPGMDGLTATQHIRALRHPARDTPIIAMTANVMPEQLHALRQNAITEVVGKPFKRQDLYAAIERQCASRVLPAPECHESGLRIECLDEELHQSLLDAIGREMVTRFVEQLRAQLTGKFNETWSAQEDKSVLAKDVHALASAAGMLGFSELCHACKEFEAACERNIEINEHLQRVQSARGRVIEKIDEMAAG